jgi:hypothetical protein
MWLPKVLRGGVRAFCSFFLADEDDAAKGVLRAIVLCFFLCGSLLGISFASLLSFSLLPPISPLFDPCCGDPPLLPLLDRDFVGVVEIDRDLCRVEIDLDRKYISLLVRVDIETLRRAPKKY